MSLAAGVTCMPTPQNTIDTHHKGFMSVAVQRALFVDRVLHRQRQQQPPSDAREVKRLHTHRHSLPLSGAAPPAKGVQVGFDFGVNNLGLLDIAHTKHKFEDAVPPRDARRIADENGARSLLWVADAAVEHAQHDGIEENVGDSLDDQDDGARHAAGDEIIAVADGLLGVGCKDEYCSKVDNAGAKALRLGTVEE